MKDFIFAFCLVVFGVGYCIWKVYLSVKHPETFRQMEQRKHEMKKLGIGAALKFGGRFIK